MKTVYPFTADVDKIHLVIDNHAPILAGALQDVREGLADDRMISARVAGLQFFIEYKAPGLLRFIDGPAAELETALQRMRAAHKIYKVDESEYWRATYARYLEKHNQGERLEQFLIR